jgi:hypothetical protein
MIRRRQFLAAATSCVTLASVMALLGLAGGCEDQVSEAPKPSPAQEKEAKEAQNKMEEFLAKKQGGAQKKH